jgi:S-adenosylmethionine decarboxylase
VVAVFFEGSEKKFEIILNPNSPSLLELPRAFWDSLVAKSEATIIGEARSDEMIAYLLSESSLFIWHDRVTMITCGRTTLANAVEYFLSERGVDQLDCLIFQRKNEFRSYLQKSSFSDDVERLKKLVPGEAYCFGQFHDHHNLLFTSLKPYQPATNDTTLELLMYDVNPKALDVLLDPSTCLEKTRKLLGLAEIIGDYLINDYCFDPFGYSLNAVRGECYLTIHVTPQKETSYISVETNADPIEGAKIGQHFLERLGPGSFDLITFNAPGELKIPIEYQKRTHSHRDLSSGFKVDFFHYFHQRSSKGEAPLYQE